MDTELEASRLFDDYTTALQRGEQPDAGEYLARCPENARQDLSEALEGVEWLARYYFTPKISAERLARLFAEIQEIQAEQERSTPGPTAPPG